MRRSTQKIKEAYRIGHRDPLVEPAIKAHMERVETCKPWAEIVDAESRKAIARKRMRLVRDGVLEMHVQRPSEIAEGVTSDLLHEMERRHSDLLYGGISVDVWVAAAEYVDSYINLKNVSQQSVAERYGVGSSSISRVYPKILGCSALDSVYGSRLTIPDSIAAMVADRRATIDMIAHRLGEPTKTVTRRVRASDSMDGLQSETFGGRKFYWYDPESA